MDGGDQKTVKPSRGRPQESCPSCNQPLISALCLPSDVYLACSGPRNSHPTQNEGHCDPPALHRSRAFSTTSRRSSIERLLGAARRRAPSSSDAAAAAGSSLLSPSSSVCLWIAPSVQFSSHLALQSAPLSLSRFICVASSSHSSLGEMALLACLVVGLFLLVRPSVLGRGDEGDGGRRGGGGGGNGGGGRWVGRRLTVWVFLRLSTSSSSPSLLLSSAASTCLVRQSFLY